MIRINRRKFLTSTSLVMFSGCLAGSRVNWSFSIGSGYIVSSPTYEDGSVFFGSTDGVVYSLDAEGNENWVSEKGEKLSTSPVATSNSVFIADITGVLYSLDPSSGETHWEYELGDRIEDSSPILLQDMVVLTGNKGEIKAINSQDGDVMWEANLSEADSGKIVNSAPATDGELIYFGTTTGEVYVLNSSNGDRVSSFDVGGVVNTKPAVSDGMLYVTQNSTVSLLAIDIETGEIMWEFDKPTLNLSSPVLSDGEVYIISDRQKLYKVDSSTGKQKWEYYHGDDIPEGGDRTLTPAVRDGVLYFGTVLPPKVYGIDVDEETKKWEVSVDDETNSPVLGDDALYVTTVEGSVYSLKIN